MDTKKIFKHIPWVILGIIGAFCLAVVALRRRIIMDVRIPPHNLDAEKAVLGALPIHLRRLQVYSLKIIQRVWKQRWQGIFK